MKNIFKILVCLVVVSVLGGGCRGIRYLAYYPHSILGADQTSAEWQEFAIPQLVLEKYDYLNVTFTQGDRVVCNTGLSLFHLCSPDAHKKLGILLAEYRTQLDKSTDPLDPKIDAIQNEMSRIVAGEPLPDLEIELITAVGDTEKYETGFAGGSADHQLPFDFRNCNQSAWNREKLDAGADEDSARYSYPELEAHETICTESHAKTFTKFRLRSPSGMLIESVKVENHNSPFAIR